MINTKITSAKELVVLFIPEAGIYPYMRGLAVLGDAARKKGGKVFVTRCSGQMKHCPMMAMNKMQAEDVSSGKKAELCKICSANIEKVQKQYKFSIIELSDFVDSELLKKIDDLVNVSDKNLENINFRGFPVGKIAQYDFILETKFPYYSNLSETHKALYCSYIKNAAIAIAIADGICKSYGPSLMLTFNEYAQCQAVRHSANTFNVRRMAMTYPVNFNIDTSRFSIWKNTYESWRYNHCQQWNKVKNVPIAAKNAIECWKDAIFRMYGSGSHIFSSQKTSDPGDVFKKLKLNHSRKTVVAYTSSQDERGSVEAAMKIWGENNNIIDAFPNQIEWLLFLRNYAAERDDIQIIVRVHPREGYRQFGFDSLHLKQLKAIFTENISNFIIIWPDDPISSYDLMELADACLVPWSLMGQEAARLGIPVLSFTGNMFYPDDDFIQVATTPEEYKRRLDSMIDFEFTWQHLVKAVRFYHWRTFIPSLDLGETVPRDFDDHSVWPEAPAAKVDVINDILSGKQDLIEYNIKQWQESLPSDAIAQETAAMKQGIRLFLDKIVYPPRVSKKARLFFLISNRIGRMFTGKNFFIVNKIKQEPFKDYCLKYSENIKQLNNFIEETKKDSKLRFLVADGLHAKLVHNGKILHRMSPVVIRLARLHQNAI